MWHSAWVFLMIALIAGLFRFGDLSSVAVVVAKIFFVVFVVLFLVSYLVARVA